MHSPRMYDVYQTLLGEVREAGVDLYNEFNFTSHDGASYFGTYGLLRDMTTPLSEAHQLRSLLDFAASQNDDDPPPPVNHAPVFAAIAPISINEAGALNVVVTATDSDLPTQTLTYSLGANAPSSLSINSTTGAVTWLAPDSSGADLYLVTVIATDNGTPDQTVVGQSGLAVAHTFATAGQHTVRVTATDRDGATSAADSLIVNAIAHAFAELRSDPAHPGLQMLYVAGTPQADQLTVSRLGNFSTTNRILIEAGNDNDTLLGEVGNDTVDGQGGVDRITTSGNGSTRTALDRSVGPASEIDDLFAYDFDAILIGMLLPAVQKVR